MTLSLPPEDAAYGQRPFEDPLVLPVMVTLASVFGVVGWPLLHLALRDRPLPMSLAILVGIVVVTTVLLTPLNPLLGFVAAVTAFLCGLLTARNLTATNT
jgi:membrane associated rhomboid family serine protease